MRRYDGGRETRTAARRAIIGSQQSKSEVGETLPIVSFLCLFPEIEVGRKSFLISAYSQLLKSGSRKEVIQPQVPLRLPCYDFGPVADPTVAGCLPCGLAHRLRVKPTPMP
jgi:hypothetical protein